MVSVSKLVLQTKYGAQQHTTEQASDMGRVGDPRAHYKANNGCHTEDKPANHKRDNALWQGCIVGGIHFVNNPEVPDQGIDNTGHATK